VNLVTFLSLMKKRESIVKAKLLKECEESEEELEGTRTKNWPDLCESARREEVSTHNANSDGEMNEKTDAWVM